MKARLFSLLLLTFLLLPPAARAADVTTAAEATTATDTVPREETPPAPPAQEFVGEARLEMDQDAPLVGDRIEYVLTATLPAGWQLDPPEELHFVEALRPLREDVSIRHTEVNNGVKVELTIPYVLVRAGRVKLPQRAFTAGGPAGETGVVQAGRIAFQTGSYFASENEPQPAEPFGPLPVVEKNWLLIWILVGLGTILVAVAATLLVMARLKPKTAPPGPPPRPAHEVALEALAALARSNLDKEGEFTLWYTELSTILRAYLGGRYAFDSMDMTTTELCEQLNQVTISHSNYHEVSLLLEDLDLVKFAKALPTQSAAQADFQRVESFVRETMARPEPVSAPVPAAPAPTTPSSGEGGEA